MGKKEKVVEELDEKDYDYGVENISEYYGDNDVGEGDEAEKSLLKDEAPTVRRVRSKFTNGMLMLTIVAKYIETGADYSLKIYSDSTEISDFRKHKGSFMTIYSIIQPMFGKAVTDKIEKLERAYEKAIKLYTEKSNAYNKYVLIYVAKKYEQKINHAMMVSKVSFETESMGGGPVARQRIMS